MQVVTIGSGQGGGFRSVVLLTAGWRGAGKDEGFTLPDLTQAG